MKKFISVLILVFLGYNCPVISQEETIKNVPQEKVFVHQNTPFILSGDFLYYNIYCINTATNVLSEISKIGYVELINSDKELIFKHKIKLEKGIGYGEFFIPSNIASGHYKLTAYTQWMKNGLDYNYFQSDVVIVNPFFKNQQNIFLNDESQESNSTFNFSKNKNNFKELKNVGNNDLLSLVLPIKKYKTREKVKFTLKGLKKEETLASISVSVRKIEDFNKLEKPSSKTYESKLKKAAVFKSELVLPELRGELLKGQVLNESNTPVSDVKVAFSISGTDNIFKIAVTNSNGIFYYNLTEDYKGKEAIVSIIGSNKNKLNIVIEDSKPFNYKNLSFKNIKISPELKDVILQQSINNQIENSYRDLRPNTIKEKETSTPFYGTTAKEYVLDEYTRFSTFKETIIEILDLVYLKQSKGERSIHVLKTNDNYNTGMRPLILMNGRIVQDHQKLLDFQTKKVKKISVDRENRYYSTQLFDGIIAIETFKGVENEDFFDSNFTKANLFPPLTKSFYFKQTYDETKKWDRIPDYRSQLLWKPNLKLNKKDLEIDFFTSDIKGDFELCVEGFTSNGKPISIKEVITVQ